MGAGYGLVPSSQAAPLVAAGQLVDLCPNERVMVDLYWHHWDLEPPLARDISALIVRVAQMNLDASAGPETQAVSTPVNSSVQGLNHVAAAPPGDHVQGQSHND